MTNSGKTPCITIRQTFINLNTIMRMTHFTLITTALLALGSATMQAQTLQPQAPQRRAMHTASPAAQLKAQIGRTLAMRQAAAKHSAQQLRALQAARFFRAASTASDSVKYLPKHQIEYAAGDANDGFGGIMWNESGQYSFVYDKAGRVVQQDYNDEINIYRTTKKWDEHGNLLEEVETTSDNNGSTFANGSKRVQVYDAYFPLLCIQKDKYDWDKDGVQWTESGDAFRRTVTRDADHNVTRVELAVPYLGQYDVTKRVINTVDPESKQISEFLYQEMTDYVNDQPVWENTEWLKNIIWHKTNGQVVDSYSNWMQYGQQLSTAEIYFTNEETGKPELGANINIGYLENGSFYERIDYVGASPSCDFTELSVFSDGLSYSYTTAYYKDLNGDGILGDKEYTEYSRETVTYNTQGDVVRDEQSVYNADEGYTEQVAGTKYDITYDETTGAQKEVVISNYDYDTYKYVPMMKIVTDEYTPISLTAINHTQLDSQADAPVMYFTIDGKRTDAHAHGVYIMKQGSKVTKIVK